MSFSILAFGNKEQIAESLDKVVVYTDPSMADAMKEAVKKIAAAAPAEVSFVLDANGYHSYSKEAFGQIGSLSLSLKIYRPKP